MRVCLLLLSHIDSIDNFVLCTLQLHLPLMSSVCKLKLKQEQETFHQQHHFRHLKLVKSLKTFIYNGLAISFIITSFVTYTVPTMPQDLLVQYISSTALKVTWNHPLCDYGIRTQYNVSYAFLNSCIVYSMPFPTVCSLHMRRLVQRVSC